MRKRIPCDFGRLLAVMVTAAQAQHQSSVSNGECNVAVGVLVLNTPRFTTSTKAAERTLPMA